MEYPKICPAVIVGVTKGDEILLTRYAGRNYKKYALIAGFAEIGETIEADRAPGGHGGGWAEGKESSLL